MVGCRKQSETIFVVLTLSLGGYPFCRSYYKRIRFLVTLVLLTVFWPVVDVVDEFRCLCPAGETSQAQSDRRRRNFEGEQGTGTGWWEDTSTQSPMSQVWAVYSWRLPRVSVLSWYEQVWWTSTYEETLCQPQLPRGMWASFDLLWERDVLKQLRSLNSWHDDMSQRIDCCCCCCHDEPVRHCLYGGTNVPKRWGIPPDSHSPGTHLWCQSNHQSNAGVLLPNLGRATVNVQPSCPHYHNVDRLGIQSGQ